MKTVLVLAPHADDEVLGCGGAIYKHVENGDRVVVAVMTNASVGAPELFNAALIEEIRREALKSHSVLGVHESVFLDFPAPQLEQYPQYKIANKINELIKLYNVEHLYIPFKGDLHLDHGVVYNAALVASRPVPGQTVKKIYAYETLSETEWGHPTADKVFIPQHFIKLSTQQFNKKITAMQCFNSQLKPFPSTRSLESIQHLAAHRGATVSHAKAEAFMIVRTIDE